MPPDPPPPPETITCPHCKRPGVELHGGRLERHGSLDRPRVRCPGSGLLPADL